MTEIIVALITGVLTLCGVIISNRKSYALTDYKISELTAEVKRHNSFAEKIPVMEEQMKSNDRRITKLENAIGN